jgi:hypothetical protein
MIPPHHWPGRIGTDESVAVLQTYSRSTVTLIASALGLVGLIGGFTMAASGGHSTHRADLQSYPPSSFATLTSW